MAREFLPVSPKVLRWARETAGYSVDEVAKKLSVQVSRIEHWEAGELGVTEGRLDRLADIYKRPTALFFLDEPPNEPIIKTPDFRRKSERRDASPSLKLQIRKAIEKAESYVEINEELGIKVESFSFRCSTDEEPEVVGARLRKALGVTLEEQIGWEGNKSRAFSRWREASELAGVLVFQTSRAQIDDARGLSLRVEPMPIAIIASGDTPNGRIYTLLHELVHIGLHETGVCDMHDDGIEKFCNEVAAAALMPRKLVEQALARQSLVLNAKTLTSAARWMCVSEQALALRLVELEYASWAFYRSMRNHFDELAEQARQKAAESSGGNVPQPLLALTRNGRVFTRTVLEAFNSGRISAHRAATVLNIGAKYLDELTRDVARASLTGTEG